MFGLFLLLLAGAALSMLLFLAEVAMGWGLGIKNRRRHWRKTKGPEMYANGKEGDGGVFRYATTVENQ